MLVLYLRLKTIICSQRDSLHLQTKTQPKWRTNYKWWGKLACSVLIITFTVQFNAQPFLLKFDLQLS